MRLHSLAICVLVGVLFQLRYAQCLIVSKTVKVEGNRNSLFVQFDRFQFLKNGTLEMDLEYSTSVKTQILLCEEKEILEINEQYDSSPKFCSALKKGSFNCTFMMPLAENQTTLDFTYVIPKKGMYYFIIENCNEQEFKVKMDYVMLNPGGEHLGYGHIPLPSTLQALLIIWLIVSILWVANWLFHIRHPVKLHFLISTVPFSKIVCFYESYIYWSYLSEYGLVSNERSTLYYTLGVGLPRFFYFMALLGISMGWCISKPKLAISDWIFTSVLVFLYVLFKILSEFIQQYFMFIVLILYIAIFRTILSHAGQNITLFKREQEYLRSYNYEGPSDSLRRKINVMRSFQTGVMLYIFVDIMVNIISVFFLYKYYWIQVLVEEISLLLLFLRIAIHFRLQNFSEYQNQNIPNILANLSGDLPMGDIEMQDIGDDSSHDRNAENENILVIEYPSPTKSHDLGNIVIAQRASQSGFVEGDLGQPGAILQSDNHTTDPRYERIRRLEELILRQTHL